MNTWSWKSCCQSATISWLILFVLVLVLFPLPFSYSFMVVPSSQIIRKRQTIASVPNTISISSASTSCYVLLRSPKPWKWDGVLTGCALSTTVQENSSNEEYKNDDDDDDEHVGDNIDTNKKDPTSDALLTKDIVDALDLYPVMQSVVKHAATKRARDAIMSLLQPQPQLDSDESRRMKRWNDNNMKSTSKKREILSSVSSSKRVATGDLYLSSRKMSRNDVLRRRPRRSILKVATSLDETREEWRHILEASEILNRYRVEGEHILPPLYGADSSPWEIRKEDASSDDDEWLDEMIVMAGSRYAACLELEDILQAEQVVKRVVRCYDWSQSEQIAMEFPHLCDIFRTVQIERVRQVLEEIQDSVVITLGKSRVSGPLDEKTYSFRLNQDRFPNLRILRTKEQGIVDQIRKLMETMFANKKFVSQLSGFTRKNPESYELNGRVVVAASKDVAKKIGVIRGYSENRSFCFVEPNEVVKLGNELQMIREEMDLVTSEISHHLSRVLVRDAVNIDKGLDAVARLDVVFARAAYGLEMNGVIPQLGNSGVIDVRKFIHPALAARGSCKTVPIDLKISNHDGERALIISGPNGGGKSLAMKSFGLVAILAKVGIPIPVDSCHGTNHSARVDFFQDVIVEVGDKQNLAEGESTYMAQLNSLSTVIEKVSSLKNMNATTNTASSTLILLDELGGGTDPLAGSSIAQAVLEKVLSCSHTRIIVTTHSTQLKALSVQDGRFTPASVQLRVRKEGNLKSSIPTYELIYGSIGDSCALAAAARTSPPIPHDVIDRAASLIVSNEESSGKHVRTIIEALENEKTKLIESAEVAEQYCRDIARCRDAVIMMARSYEQHLSRLEGRLENMFLKMKEENSRDAYDLLGETLETLRLAKKEVKTKEDVLAQKGLRLLSMSDVIRPGDSVVIIAKGDFEGETAIVASDQSECDFQEIAIDIGFESQLSSSSTKVKLKVKRCDLAKWDYPSFDDGWEGKITTKTVSINDSKLKLFNLLNTIKADDKQVTSEKTSKGKERMSTGERKVINAKTKKSKKKR